MSISSIGSSGGIDLTQMAASFFKKADTNNDGGIDKTELEAMMANGPGGGKSTAEADKAFAEIDTNADGKIDATENENQLKKIGEEMQVRSAQGGGKPPAGGPPPSSGASGGSSDSGKVYDVRDTNKDGTVSTQEAYTYSQTHPKSSEGSKETDKVKSAIDDLLNQVDKGTKYGSQGNLNNTTNGTESLFSLMA
jgi:Ca2+-binding EF-hand superfamily protein